MPACALVDIQISVNNVNLISINCESNFYCTNPEDSLVQIKKTQNNTFNCVSKL